MALGTQSAFVIIFSDRLAALRNDHRLSAAPADGLFTMGLMTLLDVVAPSTVNAQLPSNWMHSKPSANKGAVSTMKEILNGLPTGVPWTAVPE